jgi:tetratricopeptide (TPR) repeat protein
LGELPAAETTLRDALKTCTAEVDHIDGCLALGSVLKDRGQFAESCKVLEHGLALSRHLQDQMRTAQTLGNLALSLFLAGKSAEAVEAHRNALKLFTLAGNRKGLAKECVNFGGTLSACNLGAEAEQVIRTALNEARDLGLPHLEALAECNLAFLYEVSGRGEEFPGLTDSAVGKARACGDWNALATALNARASRLGNSGRLAEAESEFLELLEMVLETGNVVFEVSARGNLGVVYHRSGKLKAAESELVRAVELASTHNDSRTESYFSCQLALLYVSTGRREAAAALWRAHAANVAATLPAPFVAELEREMVQVCTCAGIPRLE